MAKAKQELSYDTKVILVVITLLLFFPIGVILGFKWMNWPLGVKIILLLPFIFIVVSFLFVLLIAVSNPGRQFERAREECRERCIETSENVDQCLQYCAGE